MKQFIYVITGPTACGKTKTAVKLAKAVNGEVISADSMQIYKYMDIGTAKPTVEEMEGIKHYCMDERMPDEAFSAALFQSRARECINQIRSLGKVPIIAGGTGFYINALLYGNDFSGIDEERDRECRERMYAVAEEKGSEYLHSLLTEVDPESAEGIHHNNVKRVVRALAYFELKGEKISQHNCREREREMEYDAATVILSMDRASLYDRINRRVDTMLEAGLIDEVRNLLDMGYGEDLVSMQGLGYKETVQYLKGRSTLAEAIETIKRDSRRYAKRQLTWFRHQCEGLWLNVDESGNWDIMIKRIVDYAGDLQSQKMRGELP